MHEVLEQLNQMITHYQNEHDSEPQEDWRAYYGGVIDGLRKALHIIDPPVHYMGEEIMR